MLRLPFTFSCWSSALLCTFQEDCLLYLLSLVSLLGALPGKVTKLASGRDHSLLFPCQHPLWGEKNHKTDGSKIMNELFQNLSQESNFAGAFTAISQKYFYGLQEFSISDASKLRGGTGEGHLQPKK